MKKVIVHGRAGELFGKEWSLDVNTPIEAIGAIKANRPKFYHYLIQQSQKGVDYSVRIRNKFLSEQELHCKCPKNETIHILPSPQGSGVVAAGIGAAISAGVAALGAALLNPMTWFFAIGAGVLTYFMNKQSKPPRPEDPVSKASYVFRGGENIVGQGAFIPIGYGRLRVGSAVVSASTVAFATTETTHNQPLVANILPIDQDTSNALSVNVNADALQEALTSSDEANSTEFDLGEAGEGEIPSLIFTGSEAADQQWTDPNSSDENPITKNLRDNSDDITTVRYSAMSRNSEGTTVTDTNVYWNSRPAGTLNASISTLANQSVINSNDFTLTVDTDNNTITITQPASFYYEGHYFQIEFLLANGETVYTSLPLIGSNQNTAVE